MRTRVIAILFFLISSLTAVQAQAFLEEPVTTEIKMSPVSSEKHVEVEIRLNIRDKVHVYTSESNNFKITDSSVTNLGKTEIILPETVKYKDALGVVADVFKEQNPVIRIRKPYTGQEGTEWTWKGSITFQGCDDTTCYLPQETEFSFSGITPSGNTDVIKEVAAEEVPFYKKGIILGILGSFIAGVLLGFTPCVYPMVGITIAIIGTGNASKKRTVFLTFIYVLGLSLVYALIGVVVASLGSAVSDALSSPSVLFPIGVVFIILGLSMFDLFTIQTPSSWGAKIQQAGGKLKGSVFGTFIMGALSAFVVGPCVSGPIIGLITFVAETGKIMTGFFYFFALAWGMGVILFIAGSFSGALPKAGEWMNRVKHVLGVILIWAAFYFTRRLNLFGVGETIFYTSGIVALALGLHAAGLFSIPEDRKPSRWLALALGLIILGGTTAYILSGFESTQQTAGTMVDLDQIVSESSKPVLLDFWAPWCVNCKEIKETVLKEPEVKTKLEKFTFLEINVDDNPDLKQRFNLIGVPAFIFLDKQGNMIGPIEVTGDGIKKRILSFDFDAYYGKNNE